MELELALDPNDAARLLRLPRLKPMRSGRAQTRRLRVVWHDSSDGALAKRGLALAEQHGVWRVERLYPGEAACPPGSPPTVLAEGRSPVGLLDPLPDPLPARAAFEGHARRVVLTGALGPVTMTVLQGDVRSLASSYPACRVLFDGPDPALLALASDLTQDLKLEVPRCSLAAEAICAALNVKPAARREGAPELPPGLSVADAFAFAVGHLSDVIQYFMPSAATGADGPEPVHQMRVATRRLRSALKVFQRAVHCPATTSVDTGLKALANRLGPTRDWDVFVTETGVAVAAAFPGDARLRPLLAAAERQRRAHHAALRTYLESAECRRLGIELACLAGGQAWLDTLGGTQQAALETPLEAFAAHVLGRRLKRLSGPAEEIADLQPAMLHAIRLHAKRLRYAAEIFSPLYPGKSTRRFVRRLSTLQQRLGVLNDGTVAATLLADLVGKGSRHTFAAGMVVGFLGARHAQTREKSSRAWERFHKLAPFWE